MAAGGYRPRNPEENPLYGVVAGNLETFLARQRERDRNVPIFVEREIREFLECGVLAHGFLRVHCDDCGLDRLVPFSCKNRGFCNSCGGRRMADTAAHLVDRVFPRVPVRQWVLSLPYALRYRLAYDARMVSDVLLATIHPPDNTRKILDCLGLPSRAPPLATAASMHPAQPDWFYN